MVGNLEFKKRNRLKHNVRVPLLVTRLRLQGSSYRQSGFKVPGYTAPSYKALVKRYKPPVIKCLVIWPLVIRPPTRLMLQAPGYEDPGYWAPIINHNNDETQATNMRTCCIGGL